MNAVSSNAVYDALELKAPKDHSSTTTDYGVATSTNYGHVKVIGTFGLVYLATAFYADERLTPNVMIMNRMGGSSAKQFSASGDNTIFDKITIKNGTITQSTIQIDGSGRVTLEADAIHIILKRVGGSQFVGRLVAFS